MTHVVKQRRFKIKRILTIVKSNFEKQKNAQNLVALCVWREWLLYWAAPQLADRIVHCTQLSVYERHKKFNSDVKNPIKRVKVQGHKAKMLHN